MQMIPMLDTAHLVPRVSWRPDQKEKKTKKHSPGMCSLIIISSVIHTYTKVLHYFCIGNWSVSVPDFGVLDLAAFAYF